MTRISGAHAEKIYGAAERFVNAALREDDSLFTPGRPIWSARNIEDLYERFVKHPDESQASFLEKFEKQLAGQSTENLEDAPAETYQLAAELIYVHLLIAARSSISGPVKRNLIESVLRWSPSPVAIPDDLSQALDQGLATVGTAFSTYRPYQITFLLEFVRTWKQLRAEEQTRLLSDPWAFKQMVFELPIHAAYTQREALLHLVFPDTFEAIVSQQHKKQIADRLAHIVNQPANDIDQRLQQIRAALTKQYGRQIDFYEPAIRQMWQDVSDVGPPTVKSPLSGSLGNNLRPYIELAARLSEPSYTPEAIVDVLGRISPPILTLAAQPDPNDLVTDLLLLRLLERLEGNRYRRWHHLTDATVDHMLRYAALTLLVPVIGEPDAYTLPFLNAPIPGERRSAVDWPLGGTLLPWYDEAGLVRRNDDDTWEWLSDALALDDGTPTLQAISRFLEHVQDVRRSQGGLPPLEDEALPVLDEATLSERIAEIQRELLIDRSTILRIYRSLIAGRHVILSGPPGTGKTHLARLLPRVLWRGLDAKTTYSMHTSPLVSPVESPIEDTLHRDGYQVEVVTATEDWGVRHVIGGIVPQLQENGSGRSLVYGVRHGCLTRTVLRNFGGDGEELPLDDTFQRDEIKDGTARYRGCWLVIDEFTRAPIDAAFGGLLTTLSGQRNPTLAVPTDTGSDRTIPLPRDFRLIGTLNSFDRHFLNQISEAMKRRFTFIDVLPPSRAYAETEQALAMFRALTTLHAQGLTGIAVDDQAGRIIWQDALVVERVQTTVDGVPHVRYQFTTDEEMVDQALTSFWRIFSVIRIYRQLGTAQAEAVYATLFAGRSVGMSWQEALDSALADVLADQLQVLARDEQRVLLAFLKHAGNPSRFIQGLREVLQQMPTPRSQAHLAQLRAAGANIVEDQDIAKLEEGQFTAIFDLRTPLLVPTTGIFTQRLSAFINERGL